VTLAAEAARRTVAALGRKYPSLEVRASGMAFMNDAFMQASIRDLAVMFPLMIVVMLGAMALLMRSALATVAVATPGTPAPAWQPFTLNGNGIWVAGGHLGPGPFNIRIADTRGHQVVILRVTLRPGRTIRTRTWMYGHGHRQAG